MSAIRSSDESAWFEGFRDVPFPTDSLPPAIKEMVRSVADVHHVPEVMPAVIALSMLSAAMRNGLHIASGRGRLTMGNLYFLVSAASGTGKSTVLRILRAPLDDIQVFLDEYPGNQDFLPPEDEAPAEVDGDSGGCVGLLPPPRNEADSKTHRGGTSATEVRIPRLFCSEITGQALAKLLAENHEAILNVTPEAGNLLDEASRTTSPLGQLLLKGYSGDQAEIDRISRKAVVLNRPCIVVCWLCQPHRLKKFLSSDRLLDDGLLARFHVAHSKAGMGIMPDDESSIPVAVSDSYGAVIEQLFDGYGRRAEDHLTANASPEAHGVLRTYHNLNSGRWHANDGPLRSCIARWTEQAWKLTLVLHAGTHGDNSHRIAVDRETAERAVVLQEWFAGQQMCIIGGESQVQESTRLKRLCELLREAPDRELTLRDLKNSHGFLQDEVRRLVQLAPSLLNLQKRQNPDGGRPSTVLTLMDRPI